MRTWVAVHPHWLSALFQAAVEEPAEGNGGGVPRPMVLWVQAGGARADSSTCCGGMHAAAEHAVGPCAAGSWQVRGRQQAAAGGDSRGAGCSLELSLPGALLQELRRRQ